MRYTAVNYSEIVPYFTRMNITPYQNLIFDTHQKLGATKTDPDLALCHAVH